MKRGRTVFGAGTVFAGLLALGLQIAAIHAHSLSGDGAYHLLAGHQALRHGQNTVNFEHPPLVKLLVSLPLLLEDEPLAGPIRVDQALVQANGVYGQAEKIRRATVRGRYVALLLFVVPLFIACYFFGRRFGDHRTGVLLVLMMSLSLSVLPYLTILQTDVAVSLAFLLAILAAAAYLERPDFRQAVLLALASGFALAVKFSGLLLGPMVLLSLLLAPRLKETWKRRLGHLVMMGLLVVAMVEASYAVANLQYDADLGREMIRIYCSNNGTLAVDEKLAAWEETLLAIETMDPRFAQWLTGFLGVRIQNEIGVYPSFAFGEVRSQGRWWYFPIVLLIKTPLAILIAAFFALLTCVSKKTCVSNKTQWREWGSRIRENPAWVLPAVTLAVYLATSVTSNYNLSVRHMLPVLPLLYLPVARFLSRRPRGALLMVAVLALESMVLAPLWMSSTNTWWLGERNPTRFVLGAGNLEYRQNFIQLARLAEKQNLSPLFVLYPAMPDQVIQPYLPEARMLNPGDELKPGWYAINVMAEQMVPAILEARPEDIYNYDELKRGAQAWEPLWQAVVNQGSDKGWAAGTFHLYLLE